MYRYLYAILVFSVLHLHANGRVPNCQRPTWLLCNNGRCIMSLFECDGENDCGDMSDEMNCTDFQLVLPDIQCASDEYQCKDRTCIPIEKFCDVWNDCPDDSDEYDGCVKELKCKAFRCNDGHCIKDEWVCDGVADCPDKSDETKCGNITIPTSQCNSENDRYLCKNQRCIVLNATCDKKDDCGDGSDEDTDGCAKAEALCTKTTKCNHHCRRTPQGPLCSCQKGYKLSDNETCADVNECENYGTCGQRCINNAGSYTCACEVGYSLQDDKKSCKAEGGEALMVFSVKSEIRGFYLDSEVYYSVARDLQYAVSVSLDANYVYWTDIEDGEEAIIKSLEDGTQREVIVTTGLSTPDEIAVDWITGNIYFSDSGYMHIGVCTNDGSYCTVIFKEQYNKPRGLALLPANGIMYWTKWGSKPGIITAGMDGKGSREFVTENMGWPNGLSIDYANNRLYWVDAKLKIIESVRLDGSDRRTVLKEVAKQPFSLAVFENNLYWSDWSSNTIQSCDKLTGKDWKILIRENSTVYGLHIYHSVLKPKIANPCNARPCSQLCLLNRNNGYTCACTVDKELSADQHTCRALKKREHLVIAAGNTFIDYYHELLGKPKMTASITFKHVTALTYDSLNGTVLAHDQLTSNIFRFDTNTGDLNNIISLKDVIVGGMDFDYIGNNLYLSNIERNTIEVHSLSSNQKTVFYFQDQPLDIALVPEEGIMFAVFHANGGYKIYKMKMSGLGPRIEIAGDSLLGPQISLCYDKEFKRIFWSDQGSGRIESTTLEGSNKYLFRTGLSEPVSLAILGDYVFWTQYRSNHLSWTDKNNTHLSQKHITLHVPKDLDMLRLVTLHGTYVRENHECRKSNGNCSHVCLVSSVHTYVCACPPSMMLDMDNRTCVPQTACGEGETKCGEHDVCIKLHQRCDGVRDCPNGEDESSYCAELNSCGDNQFRCKSGECIGAQQRCDSHYDCKDRSDEDDCDKKDCQTNEFQCREGSCVSRYQVCDGQNDCPDLSDEHDCGTHTCEPENFMCGTRKCIPKSWLCDGQDDCNDGSDEGERCQSEGCPKEMFSCHNARCLDASLKCNDIDDCGDNSDEEYCLTGKDVGSVNCTGDEYRCRGTEMCLHKKVRCNGVQDCPKNDDEHGCARCLQEQFTCDNQKCIAQSWVCDMVDDCGDKSDEKDCAGDNSRKPATGRSSGCDGFRCSTGVCLPFSKVCDKIPDCPDGSDEFGKCMISCTKDNPCQGVCHKTPAGAVCGCQSGFRLSNDARTCEDVDECNENVCSQVCRNTVGSFTCSCYDGFVLRNDRTSCKMAGPQMELITVARTGIRKLSASLSSIEVIHEELNFDISGIDVNAKDETIYWSNDALGAISKMGVKSKIRNTVTGVGRPEALAVDWITDNVYFNDNDQPSNIKVCHLEEKRCTKIFTVEGRSKAMSIVVDPTNGWLFWSQTNWLLYSNPASEIYRSDTIGANVTAIAYLNLGVVAGLAIDHMRSRLYWADTYKKTIEFSDFDGFNRRTFLKTANHQPASISIYEDSLYWLMGITGQLQKCKLHGDLSCETISVGTSNIERHFAILHISRQPLVKNTCGSHECDYMCIMKKDDFACVCENGRPAGAKGKCAEGSNPNLKFVSSTGHEYTGDTRQQGGMVAGIVVTILTSIIILSAYCYYKSKTGFSKTNGLSIRFQNPSYDQQSEIIPPINCISGLPPGEHEYINPVINISKQQKQEKEEQDKMGITTRANHSDGDSDSEYRQNTRLIQYS